MNLETDIARVVQQEARLQFDRFTLADAWDLGQRLRFNALARQAPVAIEIASATRQLFFTALEGSAPDNAHWIRRKRNCVFRFGRSSYHLKLDLDRQKTTLQARFALEPKDFAASGGSFPVALRGQGVTGAISVSGLPQREDHALIVETLAEYLDVPLDQVAFES